MSLREYKSKRHFNRTPEPAGTKESAGGNLYVIQKHQARRLHYDFRLELDGVLKSWAVPKGPSLDPSVKRLAMSVEDHPVAYGSFKGVIPEGEYGAGSVMIWDRGTWQPLGDAREGLRAGKLKFILQGQKLRGKWMLLRTSRGDSKAGERQWLLFKERDEEAKPDSSSDILEEEPLSVATDRSLDEIAAARDRLWQARARSKDESHAEARSARRRGRVAIPKHARSRPFPRRVQVQLATLAREAPSGDEWLHEIKLDGYRMICRLDDGAARFFSRNQQDWTRRLRSLAKAVAALPAKQAILDGEVVVLRADGTTAFQDLQNAFQGSGEHELQYVVFDLLYLDGRDVGALPLHERKRLLAELVRKANIPRLRFADHLEGNGPEFFKQACRLGLEGIICKRRDRPYRAGRGQDWLKVKCLKTDEFVIGGYSEPSGLRVGLGALLVGYHENGNLMYAGKVGTGFSDQSLRTLIDRLQPLRRAASPFADLGRRAAKIHWVEPSIVAQVAYSDWTRDGRLRHASFQGLREDKSAAEVKRARAIALASVANEQATSASYDARKQQFAGVRLTSPEKLLYPEQGISKLDLAEYYRSVADWILPHVKGRPLVLVRCPQGMEQHCFYQKHPAKGTPAALRHISVREKTATKNYVVVDDVAGLISLAQISALEVHAWGSREDNLEHPDRLIFDLDPAADVPWPRVVESALQVHRFLEELGLQSFVKTTGGKGLHIVVPIDRRHDWDEAKDFCKQAAELIVALAPAHYTANMSKAARSGKIFLDYHRNGRGATAVAAYSTRARPGAPIAVPLSWDELTPRTTSDRYTIRNIGKRLAALKSDPWEGIHSVRQTLSGPTATLRAIVPGRT